LERGLAPSGGTLGEVSKRKLIQGSKAKSGVEGKYYFLKI
jgi:hypothetical protein